MGRASRRKKAQRQAGRRSRADAAAEQVMLKVPENLADEDEGEAGGDCDAVAFRVWCGGADPVPAVAPRWAEGSLGARLFGGFHVERARIAPPLATAQFPGAVVITADSAHWSVAARALIRAVVFDGLGPDHPAVCGLLKIMAPIAGAELAYYDALDALDAGVGGFALDWDDDLPEFPEMDGPLFLIGVCALVEVFWAVVGEDPMSEILGVLLPALQDAVPGLDAQVAADALISSFVVHHDLEQPVDADVMARIKYHSGSVLQDLVTAGAVPPADILSAGLKLLSALAQLCRSDSASILQRPAAAPVLS